MNPSRWTAAAPNHPLQTEPGSREHVPRFRARGMVRRRSPLMAQNGHARSTVECLLSGVKRTFPDTLTNVR
jgi:hypothetical protein